MVKCFKCEAVIESAVTDGDPWETPSGGVLFEGGWNFGSGVYDAGVDGIHAEIIICDHCLMNQRWLRNVRKVTPPSTKEIVEKNLVR